MGWNPDDSLPDARLTITVPVAAYTGQCLCQRQTHPVVSWAVVTCEESCDSWSFQSYPLAGSLFHCPVLLLFVLAIIILPSCCFSSVLSIDTDFVWRQSILQRTTGSRRAMKGTVPCSSSVSLLGHHLIFRSQPLFFLCCLTSAV